MNTGKARGLPLEGVRVVDVSRFAPGPFASMLLADLGADVIIVEPPSGRTAHEGHSAVPLYGTVASRTSGTNPLFSGKRSIALDLKAPGGSDVVRRLAAIADVFIEGFRPGVADRLGIGCEQLREVKPDLVYCSVTGYGQHGPDARRVGHDLNYLALAGALATTARDDHAPTAPANALADLAAGGLHAAFAIMVALWGRGRSGEPVHLDVNMVDGLLGLLSSMEAWRAAGVPDPSWGNGLLTGAAPFYDCYRASDGVWISVAAIEAPFFERLCDFLQLPDAKAMQGDADRWPELRQLLTDAFASRTAAEVMAATGQDLPLAPVLSIQEAFDRARDDKRLLATRAVRLRSRLAGLTDEPLDTVQRYPDRPGADHLQILRDAGFGGDEIDALVEAGAVEASLPAQEAHR